MFPVLPRLQPEWFENFRQWVFNTIDATGAFLYSINRAQYLLLFIGFWLFVFSYLMRQFPRLIQRLYWIFVVLFWCGLIVAWGRGWI